MNNTKAPRWSHMFVALTVLLFAASVPRLSSAFLPAEGSIERDDPALDAIVPHDAKIEKVADDCIWTEGPIWIHAGYLLFADINNNRIMKWTPQGALSVFMKPSGW